MGSMTKESRLDSQQSRKIVSTESKPAPNSTQAPTQLLPQTTRHHGITLNTSLQYLSHKYVEQYLHSPIHLNEVHENNYTFYFYT